MTSDTDEHPGGRDVCGMWEGALSFHAFSWSATLPAPPWVHQPRSSPNSILSGFLWRLHHTDMSNYHINSFSSPSPLWRICDGAENTKPCNLDFVFLLCHLAHCLGFYGNGVSFQVQFSSLQFSHVQLFATPWTAAHQASMSITNSQSLLKFMSIKLVIPSNHLILCHPLLLPSIFLSIRVFSNESVLCIRWPKYWSFSFSISPSNEYSGLISFRIDWFDLLAVQGTLKSLLQHHSSKASILQHSSFFMVQLFTSVHDYWKNHSFD